MQRPAQQRLHAMPASGSASLRVLRAAAAAALVLLGGCGGSSDRGESSLYESAVSVQPRVAIDGLIELSARTNGRLFVDEVVFHAPSVQIKNGPYAIADVLATDPDEGGALLFRYALADGDAAGAVANERRWHLSPPGATPDSEVAFGFSPYSATPAELDDALARTGWDLRPLQGYTAFVHGYVSVEGADGAGTYSRFSDSGARSAGDAEGDPARTGGEQMAGDAEGDPAEGAGEQMAGDAEGDPAEGAGEQMAGDAEGDPAEGTGEKLAGDAEGDPAEGTGEKQASFGRDKSFLRRPGQTAGGDLVPFLLVFDSSLELGVPLAELGLTGLDDDEFLPIDLRVDVNRLLPDERLSDLDHEAAAVRSRGSLDGTAVLELDPREARRAFQIDPDKVQKRGTPKDRDEHRIELAGDPRDADGSAEDPR